LVVAAPGLAVELLWVWAFAIGAIKVASSAEAMKKVGDFMVDHLPRIGKHTRNDQDPIHSISSKCRMEKRLVSLSRPSSSRNMSSVLTIIPHPLGKFKTVNGASRF
jgi:hypothetical protein